MNIQRICFCLPFFFASVIHAQGLVNGNFDLGRNSGWIEYSKGGYALIGTAAFFASTEITPAVTPRSGQYMGRVGGFSYEICSLSETIQLPNTTPLYLKLYVQDRNSTTSECAGLWVGAQIRLFVASQTIFDSYLCYYSQLEAWTPVYFDLTAAAGQTVQITVQADAANSVWSFLYIDDVSLTNQITNAQEEERPLPIVVALSQNFPNPFNPSTSVTYDLSVRSNVTLEVTNLLGQRILTLVSGIQEAGYHTTTFDASTLPTGIYVARLTAGNIVKVQKMMLLK